MQILCQLNVLFHLQQIKRSCRSEPSQKDKALPTKKECRCDTWCRRSDSQFEACDHVLEVNDDVEQRVPPSVVSDCNIHCSSRLRRRVREERQDTVGRFRAERIQYSVVGAMEAHVAVVDVFDRLVAILPGPGCPVPKGQHEDTVKTKTSVL